jgi:hypothetical protein
MMKFFPTEWKVIKFHGSKPPTRNGFRMVSWVNEGTTWHWIQQGIYHLKKPQNPVDLPGTDFWSWLWRSIFGTENAENPVFEK